LNLRSVGAPHGQAFSSKQYDWLIHKRHVERTDLGQTRSPTVILARFYERKVLSDLDSCRFIPSFDLPSHPGEQDRRAFWISSYPILARRTPFCFLWLWFTMTIAPLPAANKTTPCPLLLLLRFASDSLGACSYLPTYLPTSFQSIHFIKSLALTKSLDSSGNGNGGGSILLRNTHGRLCLKWYGTCLSWHQSKLAIHSYGVLGSVNK
jgi:hypothetical protein